MILLNKNYCIKHDYKISNCIENINNEILDLWRDDSDIRNYYQYSVYKYCKKLIKRKKLKSVLDIGCGTATKLMKLIYPECKDICGIDRKPIIHACKEKYNLDIFFVDDIENSKFILKKQFDLIICADVIEHLLDPDKLLSYIKNYCHTDTYIIFSTPERDILRGKECNSAPLKSSKYEHIREWNSSEFVNYLNHNNFKIITHKIVKPLKFHLNPNQPLAEFLKDLILLLKTLVSKKRKSCQLVLCRLNI